MIKLTAVGSGYYKVRVNGAIVSQHVTEREAMEAASNRELANPADVVDYFHDQVVKVEASVIAEPAPEPAHEPPPVEPPPADPSGNPIDALPPGTIYEYPNSKASAVDPCPQRTCPYSGTQGQKGIMEAWSSGIYAVAYDMLVAWGGGHNDSGHNEVIAFGPVTDPRLAKWERLTEPSIPAQDSELYPDGTPSSRHNYGTLQYDPVDRSMFALCGGSCFGPMPLASRACYSFEFEPKKWRTDWPDWNQGGNHNMASDYDPVVDGFWIKTQMSSQFGLFRPRAKDGMGNWSAIGPAWYASAYMTLALDTKRHILCGIGGPETNNKRFNRFDLNNNCARTNPITTGDAKGRALEIAQAPGFVYDPDEDRFIAWNGGVDFYQIDPETLEWRRLLNDPASTANPGAPATGGTFGRMRYVPGKRGVVLVNRTTGSVFFYKLPPKTQVAPITLPVLINGIEQTLQAANDKGGTVSIGAGTLGVGASVKVAGTAISGAGIDNTAISSGAVLDKGQLVVQVPSSISNLTLKNATVMDNNGAGIRHEAGKLTVSDVKFLACQNGYLGNYDVDFMRCVFDSCGYGDGRTHGIYSGATYSGLVADMLTATECQFRGTKVGHHLKSRAKKSVVTNCVMEPSTESYSCDFPWGGEVTIDGLLAKQGASTENPVLINFGSEVNPTPFANHSLSIAYSTLASEGVNNAVAIRVDAKTPVVVYLTGVHFSGFATLVQGAQAIYSGCTNNGTPIPDTVIS